MRSRHWTPAVFGRQKKLGATVVDIVSSKNFEILADIHNVIMTGDASRALAWEYDNQA